MEVFDQPWKKPHEGVVGAFWGIYDVERNPKFSFTARSRAAPCGFMRSRACSRACCLSVFT